MEKQPLLLPERSLISSSGMADIRLRYLKGNIEWETYRSIEQERTFQFGKRNDTTLPISVEDTVLYRNK